MAVDTHDLASPETMLLMDEACKLGDLPALERLIKNKADPQNHPMSAHSLLATAVEFENLHFITYLLSTQSTISLMQSTDIVTSLLSHPNLQNLHLLLCHEPTFANITIHYGLRSFITEACCQPPVKTSPPIHALLYTFADVSDGMGPGGGGFVAALQGKQVEDVVRRMVEVSALVGGYGLSIAVLKGVDVLQMLLGKVERDLVLKKSWGKRTRDVMGMLSRFWKSSWRRKRT